MRRSQRVGWMAAGLWLVGAATAVRGNAQQAPVERPGGHIDLPSSKQITGVVPGSPQPLSSLPVAMAVSPDGRWVVTVNAGYGSFESGYRQSVAVLDTQSGKVAESPDDRTLIESKQVLFSGLAFSKDGRHLYGSIVSATDPEGKNQGDTGSGVQVYGFSDGVVTRERVLRIPLQKLAAGRHTRLIGEGDGDLGLPYPAAIAIVPQREGGERLLVADNLSDDVLLLDASTGQILFRFDVAEGTVVPGTYPVALAVTKDGRRGFVALWNGSEVAELDLSSGKLGKRLPLLKPAEPGAGGSHPAALALSPDESRLYAALTNRDAVAVLNVAHGAMKLEGYFDTGLPGQRYLGAQPVSLAVSADGSRVYCAEMGADAVAVLDAGKMVHGPVATGKRVGAAGFVPTEWMPTGVATAGGRLYITSGKGTGTGPNNFAQRQTEQSRGLRFFQRSFTYVATLLHGSIAAMEEPGLDLKTLTAEVLEDNRMKAAEEGRIQWDPAVLQARKAEADPSASLRDDRKAAGPIRHVIYLIKENRTYDQVFGDLPAGNGDKSLTMYGAEVTPNLHKLALQFGVLDNFYDSGEVSGDGHVWSNAAINSDYNERSWQLNYRGKEHGYDFEGVVANGIPLEQRIPDVAEPGTGYLWGDAARHGRTVYHFGEFIASTFCSDKGAAAAQKDSQMGPLLEGKTCAQRNEVKPGEKLPVEWGGEVNKWPWAIPLLAANHATKAELVGHFAREAPDFHLRVPDQIRVNVFERHLRGWIADRKAGRDTMPNMITMRLGNDHTGGTTPGGPTPKASVADNDLAVGRIVEAISHSEFWNDTAICVLEDDAQNGADHVDAHRSIALVVSKYSPRQADGAPLVDSRFYTTVSMIRTIESMLGLPPMNNNDAFSPVIGSVLTGAGDQPAFAADASNRDNGLIYTANKKDAAGAKESAKMDFRHEDRADARKLNLILWQDAMGAKPAPAALTQRRKNTKKDDDD